MTTGATENPLDYIHILNLKAYKLVYKYTSFMQAHDIIKHSECTPQVGMLVLHYINFYDGLIQRFCGTVVMFGKFSATQLAH